MKRNRNGGQLELELAPGNVATVTVALGAGRGPATPTGEDLAAAGIAAAEAGASYSFLAHAERAVELSAMAYPFFTADDVWQKLEAWGVDTHQHSALGAVFRKMARARSIEFSGQWTKSKRPATHNRPLRVWYGLGAIEYKASEVKK